MNIDIKGQVGYREILEVPSPVKLHIRFIKESSFFMDIYLDSYSGVCCNIVQTFEEHRK